jgi:RNA polymerase sigma factor (sigma-70 family)
MNPSDGFHDLIVRAQRGDRAAVDALLEVIRPWLWQSARGFADADRPDESTADLAQSAWLKVWQSLDQFQGPKDTEAGDAQTLAMFRAWALQIVRRLGMNAVRDRNAGVRRPPGGVERLDLCPPGQSTRSWGYRGPRAADPSPSACAEAIEQAERIAAALERLSSEEDREIVRLRFVEGLSLRQIGSELSRNHEHVRQRFHAAMRILERELEGLQ